MQKFEPAIPLGIQESVRTKTQNFALSEQFRSLMELHDPVVNLGKEIGLSFYRDSSASEAFDPFDGTQDIKPEYASRYIDAESPFQIALINEEIDRENKNQEIAATASIPTALASGLVNPVTWIPLAGLGAKGLPVWKSATRVAGSAAAIEAGSEMALHSMQETRTLTESLQNIGMSTVLSGAIGGGIQFFRNGGIDIGAAAIAREVEQEFAADLGNSASAAKYDKLFVDEAPIRERLEKSGLTGFELEKAIQSEIAVQKRSLLGIENAFGAEILSRIQDPVYRLVNSPTRVGREVVAKLAEVPFYRKGTKSGAMVADIPVTDFVKAAEADIYSMYRNLDDLFTQYRTDMAKKTGGAFAQMGYAIKDAISKPVGKMTRIEFEEEIVKAARRGGKHDITQVQQGAQKMREIFDKYLDMALNTKKANGEPLLPEDVLAMGREQQTDYVMRIFDKPYLVANEDRFRKLNEEGYFQEQREKARQYAEDWRDLHDKSNQLLKEAKRDLRREISQGKKMKNSARDQLLRLARDERHAKLATLKAERYLKKINDRVERFRPDTVGEDAAEYSALLRNLRRGGPASEPVSLAGFVRRQGGVKDEGGDLKSQDVSKATTGIINNKSGRSLDDLGEAAQEAGYYLERPSTTDLLDDIQADIRGESKIYRASDEDFFMESSYIAELGNMIERNGMNVNDIKDAAHLKKILDNLPNADVHYRQATPTARAKFRELLWHQRRATENLESLDNVVIDLEEQVILATQKFAEAKHYGASLADRVKAKRKEIKRTQANVAEAKKQYERNKWWAEADDQEIRDRVSQMIDRIKALPAGRFEYEYDLGGRGESLRAKRLAGQRGPLKGRAYTIDDLYEYDGIRFEEFLVNDPRQIINAYVNSMSRQIGMVRQFGNLDLDDIIVKHREEFRAIRQNIMQHYEEKIAANPEKADALRKQMQNKLIKIGDEKTGLQAAEEADIMELRDRNLGNYEIPDDFAGKVPTALRLAMAFNYMRYMGGITVSQVADPGRIVMAHGMARVYGSAVKPMIKNFKKFREAMKQIPELGVATDVVLHTTALRRAGVEEFMGHSSRIESFMSRRSAEFSALALGSHMNSATKQIAGLIAQSRIVDAARQMVDGSIAKNDRAFLMDNFIGPEEARHIVDMFDRWGESLEGLRIPNSKRWGDSPGRQPFEAAVRRAVDTTIITPGINKPRWTSTRGFMGQLGPVVAQFKSFTLASQGKTLLTGLQQRDMNALQGAATMMFLGMLVYAIKSPDHAAKNDDPLKWIIEGIDRGGLAGWFMEVNNLSEKFTRGQVGLNALTSQGPMSRYASRSIPEALLGPTLGTIVDLQTVISSLAAGDFNESDVRTFRKLLVYQNHVVAKLLFDAAEEGIARATGVAK